MAIIDLLVALISKIFPNEERADENIVKRLRQPTIKAVQPSQASPGGVYASERIMPNPLAKNNQLSPYAMFKKMRHVGGHHSGYMSYHSNDADTFREQAAFMEDFTDDYNKIVPLDTYYATYEKMNDAQLRTYFTWRTKARQGVIENTSLSYVFCHIFELLNDVGADSPRDVIEKLISLWTGFRRFDDKLDDYLRRWIRDYYISRKLQLPAEFSEYSRRFPVPYHGGDLELLTKAKACGWDDLRVIEASSSFKITNGQFYKAGNQELIERCACFIIRELAKIFKSGGVDFQRMFFETQREKLRSLFQGAVRTNVVASPIIVELDAFETMKYMRRSWYREYIDITRYRPVIGYILKLIEVKMRQRFDYKRGRLQAPNISAVENSFLNSEPEKFNGTNRPTLDKLKVWKGRAFAVINSDSFEAAVIRSISDFCKAERIVIQDSEVKIIKPIEIDMSKLKDIEREHMETAKKLILEEPSVNQADMPVPAQISNAPKPEITEMAEFRDSLNIESGNLLNIILHGGQAPSNSELLVETINEKALEAINDNLIDYAEGVPYVYSDYIDDLKSLFGG
ncbi:MAG: TerB N-terminal domain-containing protein [Clostridiales bacterium]|jgi:hypothetical protein|nr:TerB N-terminal domain-containing protein [Clostridiales bacterium]